LSRSPLCTKIQGCPMALPLSVYVNTA
jgi:hypothetical protein